MKIKLTLTPEAAVIVQRLYEAGDLDDIGVTNLTAAIDLRPEQASDQIQPETPRPQPFLKGQPLVTLKVTSVSPGPKVGNMRRYHATCNIVAGYATSSLLINNPPTFQIVDSHEPQSTWRIPIEHCMWIGGPAKDECHVHLSTRGNHPCRIGDIIEILSTDQGKPFVAPQHREPGLTEVVFITAQVTNVFSTIIQGGHSIATAMCKVVSGKKLIASMPVEVKRDGKTVYYNPTEHPLSIRKRHVIEESDEKTLRRVFCYEITFTTSLHFKLRSGDIIGVYRLERESKQNH